MCLYSFGVEALTLERLMHEKTGPFKDYLTIREIAEMKDKDHSTVFLRIKRKKIPYEIVGNMIIVHRKHLSDLYP